jgi:peptidoglycan/xylan/chitin deacetylase (PgdA/CDA1 family)
LTARFTAVTWSKKAVKLALLAPASVGRIRSPGLIVLIYHRVGAGMEQEMDLPVSVFRAQMAHLRDNMEVVPLGMGLDDLSSGREPERDRVCVTFDDGYEEVYSNAWPVLADLGIPATAFVATGFMEGEFPAPLRPEVARSEDPPRPMSWAQLSEMIASGLMTVGSHSHSHRPFDRLSSASAEAECRRAKGLIEERLGTAVPVFAYPQAVSGNEDAVARHHSYAVAGVGSKNLSGDFHPLRVRRTPVRASDGMFFFRRRLEGIRPLEDALYESLRGGLDG